MAGRSAIGFILFLFLICGLALAQYPDQVLLKDVQVLTLRQGHMTAGRRSSPVPQLKCVGGTANCKGFVPQVVQCYNRGSDGIDVQWECKTDMDNAYRFGRTDVTCEGYSYPDDPFILKGSCGLEYTIDLTKEGYEQQSRGSGYQQSGGYYSKQSKDQSSSWGGGVALIAIVIIVYIVYKNFLAQPMQPDNSSYPRPDRQPGFDPPPPYRPRDDDDQGSSPPPPPGFKPEYSRGASAGGASYRGGASSSGQYYGSSSYSGTQQQQQQPRTDTGNTGGGFWTGAAAGGVLGYLFGSSNRENRGAYHNPYPGTGGWGGSGWGGGWGGGASTGRRAWDNGGSTGGGGWFSSGSTGSSYSSSGGGGSSTGTRTASGFGGTNRR